MTNFMRITACVAAGESAYIRQRQRIPAHCEYGTPGYYAWMDKKANLPVQEDMSSYQRLAVELGWMIEEARNSANRLDTEAHVASRKEYVHTLLERIDQLKRDAEPWAFAGTQTFELTPLETGPIVTAWAVEFIRYFSEGRIGHVVHVRGALDWTCVEQIIERELANKENFHVIG